MHGVSWARRSSVILVFGVTKKYVAAPLGSARAAQERMVYAHNQAHNYGTQASRWYATTSRHVLVPRPWPGHPTPPRTRSHSLRSLSSVTHMPERISSSSYTDRFSPHPPRRLTRLSYIQPMCSSHSCRVLMTSLLHAALKRRECDPRPLSRRSTPRAKVVGKPHPASYLPLC